MPAHWEKALRRNGQMAVDIIMCVQKWHIEPESVPDTRHDSMASVVDEAELNSEMKLPSESGINGGAEEEDDVEEDEDEDEETVGEPTQSQVQS